MSETTAQSISRPLPPWGEGQRVLLHRAHKGLPVGTTGTVLAPSATIVGADERLVAVDGDDRNDWLLLPTDKLMVLPEHSVPRIGDRVVSAYPYAQTGTSGERLAATTGTVMSDVITTQAVQGHTITSLFIRWDDEGGDESLAVLHWLRLLQEGNT